MTKDYIIMGLVILAVIVIIVSIIKKAVKLAVFILAIFIGIGLYNIVVKGRSPVDVVNDYITNFKYARDIAGLTGKVNSSAGNIKAIIESGKLDKTSVDTLKKENSNLHDYQQELKQLKHTEGLNGFHDKYSNYLNTIVAISDTAVKASSSGSGTLTGAQDMLAKIKDALDNLVSLKI